MLAETSCEICAENDWEILGQRTYTESQGKDGSPFTQKRFRVLFDKWFPGKANVTLKSTLCRRCGFIIYMPRPEEQDIDSKYRYINELGQDYGQSISADSPVVVNRSNNLLRYLNKNIDFAKVNRILDYGGGDGRLMHAFSKSGKQCYLVDYNKNCVRGVTKLSDTINDLDPGEKFDLIICSHVLEHVAQPVRILKLIASHLNEEGQIFIEVPLEVWKRPPLHEEPVTHINFFTPNSLNNLMLVGGLHVLRCEIAASPHQSGGARHAIRAIGRRASNPNSSANMKLLKPDGMELLKPSVLRSLRYHMYVPLRVPKAVLGKLRRLAK